MTDSNVAYQHLLNSVLKRHQENRNNDNELVEDDFFEFTEDELRRIVDALWADRYSLDRRAFVNAVSEIIGNKVSNE